MATKDLLTELAALGCDTEGAMERTLGDLNFYTDCLNRFLDDGAMAALGEGIAAGDARRAFEQAHSVKGVAGMLGLTPMYARASALTETLRAGVMTGAAEDFAALTEARAALEGLMRSLGIREARA